MTTELLPPIFSTPFSKHFGGRPYVLHDDSSFCSTQPTVSATSLTATLSQRPRQASPASIFSAASAPPFVNNENAAPPRNQNDVTGPYSLKSASAVQLPGRKLGSVLSQQSPAEALPTLQVSPETSLPPEPKSATLRIRKPLKKADGAIQRALVELQAYKGQQQEPQLECMPLLDRGQHLRLPAACNPDRPDETYQSPHYSSERPHGLGSTCAESVLAQRQCGRNMVGNALDPCSINIEPLTIDHDSRFARERLSTSSSGFVHTMKTASLSNASFSIMPRSFRLGQSSETHGLSSSLPRFSVDSDRPPTNSSMDEAAIQRGVKRRQILEELTITEEGYVADLKALLYLMSTLLPSSTSISNRVRSSMLGNLENLLHAHEQLLEQFHRAAFKAAARKWADTISPRRLRRSHHTRWHSIDSSVAVGIARTHRQTRSSMESPGVSRAKPTMSLAEPADVAAIASIFKSRISHFFAYEEYCANRELVAQELQKHMSTSRTTYQTGIEGLARSIGPLEQKSETGKKALTVADLLIKPVQRLCRYPLILEDLLKQTPVTDDPSAHAEIDLTLQCIRDIVQAVNAVTDSSESRIEIQRRWSLQHRLNLSNVALPVEHFRSLGKVALCGVLHIAYQTKTRVDGGYSLCVLFDNALLIAVPTGATGKFEAVALINLSDLNIESPSDGKGLQCHSALHTWKICFVVDGVLHEFILSACSTVEEKQWKAGLQGALSATQLQDSASESVRTTLGLDLKSVGMIYSQQGPLARRLSVQRAATVGNRASICQVIVRNTANPQDLHDFRRPSSSAIARSHSHMTSNRIVVLAPKRSERARLESSLADVWTKDKLPYPGMVASRGGQIIRASAGSLVRKLSLASLQGSFSRRSASITVSSRTSYDRFSEGYRSKDKFPPPAFEIRRESVEEPSTPVTKRKPTHLPELDTMDSLVNRMIGDTTATHKPPFFSHSEGPKQPCVKIELTPTDAKVDFPATANVLDEKKGSEEAIIEEGLTGKKKRWSNPLGMLKGLSTESIKSMLHSSK